MTVRSTIRLDSPCSLRHRDLAVRLVAEACRLVGDRPAGPAGADDLAPAYQLSNGFDAAVVSAFAEIYNNIARHAYQGQDGTIQVVIFVEDSTMTIEVRDGGRTFELDDVAVPDLDQLPQGGLGLHIARAMVDSVEYEPGPPNLWRLIKRLVPAPSTT